MTSSPSPESLFLARRFPSSGPHQLSSGKSFHSPFRTRDMSGAMLFGTVDQSVATALLEPHGLHPVTCGEARAIGCLWLTDFLDSTVGAYCELTVTLLVSEKPLEVPWINEFTPLAAQLRPDVIICEYVLVLDNRDAIDYGKGLHGFDKHPGELSFAQKDGSYTFEISQEKQLTLRGQFRERGLLALPGAILAIGRAHGLLKTLRLLAAPFVRMPVITPKTVRQVRSELYFRGTMRLYPWGSNDRLELGETSIGKLLRSLQFKPTAVERVLDGEGLMPISNILSAAPEAIESREKAAV